VTVFWACKHMPSCYHKKSAVSRTFLHIFKIYSACFVRKNELMKDLHAKISFTDNLL